MYDQPPYSAFQTQGCQETANRDPRGRLIGDLSEALTHLQVTSESFAHAGLEDGGQQTTEIQPHTAQGHPAIHAMLQHRRQVTTLRHTWQGFTQGVQIEYPV
jgi:hypothetical protein